MNTVLREFESWELHDRLLATEAPLGRSLYRSLIVEQRDEAEVGRMYDMSREAIHQWRTRLELRAARFAARNEA